MNRRHSLCLATAIWCAVTAVTAGCTRGKDRTVIAANDEYTVIAVGRIDRQDVRNTFDVTKRGQPYVADAYLYWDSDSFEDESPVRQWIATNALYIGNRRAARSIHDIVLRNDSTSAVKWVRVGAQDFFLVFDLAAGAFITLPCRRWEGGYGFSVEGEFQDGKRIERAHVQANDSYPRTVSVVITDVGASISVSSR